MGRADVRWWACLQQLEAGCACDEGVDLRGRGVGECLRAGALEGTESFSVGNASQWQPAEHCPHAPCRLPCAPRPPTHSCSPPPCQSFCPRLSRPFWSVSHPFCLHTHVMFPVAEGVELGEGLEAFIKAEKLPAFIEFSQDTSQAIFGSGISHQVFLCVFFLYCHGPCPAPRGLQQADSWQRVAAGGGGRAAALWPRVVGELPC